MGGHKPRICRHLPIPSTRAIFKCSVSNSLWYSKDLFLLSLSILGTYYSVSYNSRCSNIRVSGWCDNARDSPTREGSQRHPHACWHLPSCSIPVTSPKSRWWIPTLQMRGLSLWLHCAYGASGGGAGLQIHVLCRASLCCVQCGKNMVCVGALNEAEEGK